MRTARLCCVAGAFGCALAFQSSVAAAAHSKEKVLYPFTGGTDGAFSYGGLVDVNGRLYGTTGLGGAHANGTVFTVDASSGAETVVYSFAGNRTDGSEPEAGLIDVDGTLYGTTAAGGVGTDDGTVFSIDPKTGTEKVLYSFAGGTDGAEPAASVIEVKGTLYGTTPLGGANGHGTVFGLDLKTGAEKVIYSFASGADGSEPAAGMVYAKGLLYGTTSLGGSGGSRGTAFSLDPKTGAETVLYSFCSQQNCTDGYHPVAGVIYVNGTLYGTTSGGGASAVGAVFSLDPKTGAEKVIHAFSGATDGDEPVASVIDVNGILYGTTELGGNPNCASEGCGTIFSLDPKTGAEKVLYAFCSATNCTDGEAPYANVIDVKGSLYGTTYEGGDTDNGGSVGYGTVFVLKKP